MISIHDISQTALAGAVLTLGLVILLELRSIVRLRRLVDGHLARVFEQLDLLRYENQQLIEAQSGSPRARRETAIESRAPARISAPVNVEKPPPQEPARSPAAERGLAKGEARLLASMVAARAKFELPRSATSGR
jgi:hypothetical protein